MITNTLVDPDMLKINNEVAKAQLKKRLKTEPPGPGAYETENKKFSKTALDPVGLMASETKLKNS